eukprot:2488170-Pleurochrysis_carterae.AAC.1
MILSLLLLPSTLTISPSGRTRTHPPPMADIYKRWGIATSSSPRCENDRAAQSKLAMHRKRSLKVHQHGAFL